MKNLFYQGIKPFLLAFTIFIVWACNNHPDYSFKNPIEAISACKSTLSNLKKINSSSIKDLGEIIRDWHCLEDSAYNCFIRNSASDNSNILVNDFFIISDSIRTEIIRIATSESRNFRDVLQLKLISIDNERTKTQKSRAYIEATKFYNSLSDSIDGNSTITIANYHELLTTSEAFKTEGDMLRFIAQEDRCFRSLLHFILEIPQEELQEITNLTAGFFDELTKTVSIDTENSQNNRIRIYLMMRFNRRILQNAEICAQFIRQGVILNEQQSTNFKWMLIQPFFSIDNYSMTLISEEQKKTLYNLADEVIELLVQLDNDGEVSKTEVAKLSEVLTEYFMKSYLRINL